MIQGQNVGDPVVLRVLEEVKRLNESQYHSFMNMVQSIRPLRSMDKTTEHRLLKKITTGGPSNEQRQRMHILMDQHKSGVLPEAERIELDELIRAGTQWGLEKTRLVIQLAGLRGKSVVETMEDLDLKNVAIQTEHV